MAGQQWGLPAWRVIGLHCAAAAQYDAWGGAHPRYIDDSLIAPQDVGPHRVEPVGAALLSLQVAVSNSRTWLPGGVPGSPAAFALATECWVSTQNDVCCSVAVSADRSSAE